MNLRPGPAPEHGTARGSTPDLHTVLLSYYYEVNCPPEELLTRYFLLKNWAHGLAQAGANVTVLQRYPRDLTFMQDGVRYRFLADRLGPRPRRWQVPLRLHQFARSLSQASLERGEAALVHLNGLVFPLQARHLRRSLPAGAAIAAQHHAERPWAGLGAPLQRWGMAGVDGFLFTARALAEPWIEVGILAAADVYEVPEGSSSLAWQDRSSARAATGLSGSPVVLWTGNLDANKDPFTVVAGFERVLSVYPQARLYMAYRHAGLLPQVQQFIARSPALQGAVELLGSLPYSEIGAYYNSADLFVQGSHREGSGIALMDALTCGVIPVITDIPSFRRLTDSGRIGQLWPVENQDAFVEAMLSVLRRPLEPQALQARRYFDAQLSCPAVGRQAFSAYRDILARRSYPR